MRSEGVPKLHRHVPEPAQPDDADLVTLADLLQTQRRVGRDPGAQERSGRREVEFVRKAQHEILVDHDALRITAVGDAAGVRVRTVVGKGHPVFAKLFEIRLYSSRHLRQESTMQPTAARSPSRNFFTSLPTLTTRPTIS